MSGNRRRAPREKDLTARYLSGGLDDVERVEQSQRFSHRSANAEQLKIIRTSVLRAAEAAAEAADGIAGPTALLLGQVRQVFSLYCDVEYAGGNCLCVVRKTLARIADTPIIVGDEVRFRPIHLSDEGGGGHDAGGQPQGVIEEALPRRTVLARADSFKGNEQHPIVANADQMLIVASLAQPAVRWGLVDRMVVAARGGGLRPLVCLNKIDLADEGDPTARAGRPLAEDALAHYASLGIPSIRTSVQTGAGVEELQTALRGQITVLAGHSGVGKSSLIRAVQPSLDLRVAAISGYTGKGRHTTTSARHYALDAEGGGAVIDTPGVKLFGLWGVTRATLPEFFPDVAAGTAPPWRTESCARIKASLLA